MSHIPENLGERAQWHLCLSHAFLTPRHVGTLEALRDDLVADLAELNATLGLGEAATLEHLHRALHAIPDQEQLLLTYSRLFLAPPAPALPNLGFYLDGALMGSSCQQIEDLYSAYGLTRDDDFHDTADHIALYLQFIAWIYAQVMERIEEAAHEQAQHHLLDAYSTLRKHALPAMERFIEQLDKAQAELKLPSVYGELARLARAALLQDAAAIHRILPEDAAPLPTAEAPPAALEEATTSAEMSHCTLCGKAFVAEAGLQQMISTLAEKGLSTDHMLVCADCRASEMGMQPMKPPQVKKASQA